jgi:hypothetical protein
MAQNFWLNVGQVIEWRLNNWYEITSRNFFAWRFRFSMMAARMAALTPRKLPKMRSWPHCVPWIRIAVRPNYQPGCFPSLSIYVVIV